MPQTFTDWKYFVPDQGEDASDAAPIPAYSWQSIYDAEDAAGLAAEDEWSSRGGWEAGMGDGPDIVVISPDGQQTRFTTCREAQVRHSVSEVAE